MPPAPPDLLRLRVSGSPQLPVLHLSGELDLATAVALRARLAALTCDPGSPDRLVVDLSDLAFCDASGLRALFDAHRRLARSGGEVCLRGCSPLVRQVLGLLGVDIPVEPQVS